LSPALSHSIADSLTQASRHHQEGRLDEAELLYRRILDEEPQQPDALHLLGVVFHQRGRHERAIELMARALAVRPGQATFHGNLAEAFRAAGNLPEARKHAETAVRLDSGSAVFHNTLGLALQGEQRHAAAVEHFQTAIRMEPRFALAHNNLALSLRELQREEDALACLREALRLDPSLPQAHNNLGQMLLERHESEEALVHCREALRLRPGYPEALNNLGNVLRDLGQLEEAKNCYQSVLQVRPGQAMTHNNMGQALQEEGRLDEALACYQRALTVEPNSARFLCNLASALKEKDRNADALAVCRHALQAEPAYPEAQQLHGFLLEEEGDVEGALACYREAIRLKPHSADAHVGLGHLLAEQGELDQAQDCFREALKYEPKHAGAFGSLGTTLRGKLPEQDLEAARRLLDQSLSQRKKAALHYGLAHVLDARGSYAEAGEHLRQANEMRVQLLAQQGKGYHPAAHEGFIAQLMAGFDADFFKRVQGWGQSTEVPVFIVGLPRSGTTLTEQILASHPQVRGAGELRFARETFDSLQATCAPAAPAENDTCAAGRYTREAVASAAGHYLERLRKLAPQAQRIVDKMPDNYLYLGLLATLFPRARFIHTRRDVRDTALSCLMTDFKQIYWACDLGHIASRIRAYERVMDHWRTVLPVSILEVDYEATVDDLEGVARRLVAWCSLDWDPACLEFHKTRRPIRTASVTQVRRPIYKTSVQRWKNYRGPLAALLALLPDQNAVSNSRGQHLRDADGQ
jgi:tetratricopeptide (TPR) repeat protein